MLTVRQSVSGYIRKPVQMFGKLAVEAGWIYRRTFGVYARPLLHVQHTTLTRGPNYHTTPLIPIRRTYTLALIAQKEVLSHGHFL